MLHILNGDIAADILRRSGVSGDILPWREALFDGPTPRGLAGEEWLQVRADFIAREYDLTKAQCLTDLRTQQLRLESAPEEDEIILWFEHDLFCQLILLYLLDWLAVHATSSTVISLVCIGEYPGIDSFHGLGQLSPEQMAALMADRIPVDADMLALGRSGWKAYCASIPMALESFLAETDTRMLPYLAPALKAHLRRYPSVRNGLGSIENAVLTTLLKTADSDFWTLFKQVQQAEPLLGFGDLQLCSVIKRMMAATPALLTVQMPASSESGNLLLKARYSLTEHGREIQEGKADFIDGHGVDYWLGGVRLTAKQAMFRYDEAQAKIVRTV